jgi:hypothetical protein
VRLLASLAGDVTLILIGSPSFAGVPSADFGSPFGIRGNEKSTRQTLVSVFHVEVGYVRRRMNGEI